MKSFRMNKIHETKKIVNEKKSIWMKSIRAENSTE